MNSPFVDCTEKNNKKKTENHDCSFAEVRFILHATQIPSILRLCNESHVFIYSCNTKISKLSVRLARLKFISFYCSHIDRCILSSCISFSICLQRNFLVLLLLHRLLLYLRIFRHWAQSSRRSFEHTKCRHRNRRSNTCAQFLLSPSQNERMSRELGQLTLLCLSFLVSYVIAY